MKPTILLNLLLFGTTIACAGAKFTAGDEEVTGGEAGNSAAGSSNTGGNANSGGSDNFGGSNNAGGISASGAGGTCEPLTCLDIAARNAEWTPDSEEDPPEPCGIVDDGCGNLLDCGVCSFGGEAACGAPNMVWDTSTNSTYENPGIPAVCGGRCAYTYDPIYLPDDCNSETYPKIPENHQARFECPIPQGGSFNDIQLPEENCTQNYDNIWCCSSSNPCTNGECMTSWD